MPKYWGKQIFTHGRFPEVGQNQKTEERRAKVGNNNGQLRIATPPREAHAKPPGTKLASSFLKYFSQAIHWELLKITNIYHSLKYCTNIVPKLTIDNLLLQPKRAKAT